MSVENLMKLLAEMTGWSDQSLGVVIGFKRARNYTPDGDSEIDSKDWGFTASTTICGWSDRGIGAQGKTLEAALEALARELLVTIERHRSMASDRYATAVAQLKKWEDAHGKKNEPRT